MYVDIVSYGRERELGSVLALAGVAIFVRDWTCTAVGTSEAIQTDYEESGNVEGLPWTAHEWAPPVCDICTAAECMAYNEGVVSLGIQLASFRVCDGYIMKSDARFEGEGRDDCDLLFGNEGCERVLRLGGDSLYGI